MHSAASDSFGRIRNFWSAGRADLIIAVGLAVLAVVRPVVLSSTLRLVPDDTKFDFMRFRRISFPDLGVLSIIAILLYFFHGLNFGIDFVGGTLMEVQSKAGTGRSRRACARPSADSASARCSCSNSAAPTDVLIRIAAAAGRRGGAAGRRAARCGTRSATRSTTAASRWSGPRVSSELLAYGTIGLMVAILAILVYLWFRFEWQFALGAMIANVHDIVLTIGFMSITQIDFDLTSIAALLTILGYSLNDTVVIYDRIREMLRRYKRMPMPDLLNISVNSTLSRSIITHVTVTLALLALLLFGGQAIHSFTATMMFGVVLVGTYTSIFIAAPILIYLGVGTSRPCDRARARGQEQGQGLRRRWPPAPMLRICRGSRRSTPTARAAFASPACRIAARSCACRAASGPGRWCKPTRSTRRRSRRCSPPRVSSTHFILGTGVESWIMPAVLQQEFRARGIVAETMTTGAAVSTYNILLGERRRIAAGLIAVE